MHETERAGIDPGCSGKTVFHAQLCGQMSGCPISLLSWGKAHLLSSVSSPSFQWIPLGGDIIHRLLRFCGWKNVFSTTLHGRERAWGSLMWIPKDSARVSSPCILAVHPLCDTAINLSGEDYRITSPSESPKVGVPPGSPAPRDW